MTHPIVEGLTEAVTMEKLMRENERLQRELAEERALCDRLYSVALFREDDPMPVIYAYRNKRGEG